MNMATREFKQAPLSAGDHDSNVFGVNSQNLNVAKHIGLGTSAEPNVDSYNGTDDVRAAIALADAEAVTTSCILFFPVGTYRIASNITISALCFFAIGAKLKSDSGVTVTFSKGFVTLFDDQHCLDISSGGTFAALSMPNGRISPMQFGALADGLNNDSPAIQAAGNFASLTVGGHATFEVVYPCPKTSTSWYRLESTVFIGRCAYHRAGVPAHARATGAVRLRPVSGLGAAMVFMGSYSSVTTSTEHTPANPPHSDPWVVYETVVSANADNGDVNLYVCKLAHTASAATRPGRGSVLAPTNSWPTYWTEYSSANRSAVAGQYPAKSKLITNATLHGPAWVDTTAYKLSPGLGMTMFAGGSHMTGLMFEPLVDGEVKFGVVHTCPMHFDSCVANNFGQAGFASRGQSNIGYTPLHNLMLGTMSIFADIGTSNSPSDFPREYTGSGPVQGGCNQASFTNCKASSNGVEADGGHGFYAEGNTSGIIKYDNCDAQGNAGAGFCDNTSVGCNYQNNHSAQNSWRVFHAGTTQRYMCIKGHAASLAVAEPGTGAEWNKYWVVAGGTVTDGTWVNTEYYNPCGGINVCDLSNGYATIYSHYSEGGIEKGVVPRDKTQMHGGLALTNERVVFHEEFWRASGWRGNGDALGSFGHTSIRDPFGSPSENGTWIGTYSTTGGWRGQRLISHGDQLDSAIPAEFTTYLSELAFEWNTTKKWYGWTKARLGRVYFAVTGYGFNLGGYTGADIDGMPVLPHGVLLGGGLSTNADLIRIGAVNADTYANALTALNGQTVRRGQSWEFNQPVAGGRQGVKCITAGVVGSGAVLEPYGSIGSGGV